MANFYVSSVAYTAVAQWAVATAYSVGDIVRQLAAPTVNSERCFRCTTAGTSGGSEPAWTLTNGATTTDNSVTWTECTGLEAHQHLGGSGTWRAPAARINCLSSVSGGKNVLGSTDHQVFLSSDHAETQATALTIGTGFVNRIKVISADRTGSIPPAQADYLPGAAVSTTGASAITISPPWTEFRGITFTAGSGATAANLNLGTSGVLAFFDCTLALGTTSVAASVSVSSTTWVRLFNTTISFGGTTRTSGIIWGNHGVLEWFDTPSAISGNSPTTLFNMSSNFSKILMCAGLDLSGFSGTTLALGNANGQIIEARFRNCRLGTTTVSPNGLAFRVEFVNCATDGANYQRSRFDWMGDVTTSSSTYRSGGATDGTTPISRTMINVSDTDNAHPTELHLWQWNDTVGSPLTATVEISGSVALKDDEIWLEIEYLGNASYPISSLVDDRADILGTAANQDSSSATWISGGAVNQKLVSPSFTPQMKGLVHGVVKLTKFSATVSVCPKMAIS